MLCLIPRALTLQKSYRISCIQNGGALYWRPFIQTKMWKNQVESSQNKTCALNLSTFIVVIFLGEMFTDKALSEEYGQLSMSLLGQLYIQKRRRQTFWKRFKDSKALKPYLWLTFLPVKQCWWYFTILIKFRVLELWLRAAQNYISTPLLLNVWNWHRQSFNLESNSYHF